MEHSKTPVDIKEQAFEFFYWFSRFEFALKERKYLKYKKEGNNAEPDWDEFIRKWERGYTITATAQKLILANPQRQIVGQGLQLHFRDVGLDHKPSDLGKVILLAKTVRNNLFHGGKHGADGWDNQKRIRELLPLVVKLFDELAEHAGFEDDYRRHY